jgi:hypothetical protein
VNELWAERLREAGAEVSFWRSGGRSGAESDRMEATLRAWLGTLDVAIVGLANCGSCPPICSSRCTAPSRRRRTGFAAMAASS